MIRKIRLVLYGSVFQLIYLTIKPLVRAHD